MFGYLIVCVCDFVGKGNQNYPRKALLFQKMVNTPSFLCLGVAYVRSALRSVYNEKVHQKLLLRVHFYGVPSGIRTHDIQNHNLTL